MRIAWIGSEKKYCHTLRQNEDLALEATCCAKALASEQCFPHTEQLKLSSSSGSSRRLIRNSFSTCVEETNKQRHTKCTCDYASERKFMLHGLHRQDWTMLLEATLA